MRTRTVRLALAAPLGALALAACSAPADTNETADDAMTAPEAAQTDLAVEPTGAKVDVTLPETPMTNTPVEAAKAP